MTDRKKNQNVGPERSAVAESVGGYDRPGGPQSEREARRVHGGDFPEPDPRAEGGV